MAEICDVCRQDIDECACPICDVCNTIGNPKCYEGTKHRACTKGTNVPPLKYTRLQFAAQIELRQAMLDNIMNDDVNFLWELTVNDKESEYFIDDELFESISARMMKRYKKWLSR